MYIKRCEKWNYHFPAAEKQVWPV